MSKDIRELSKREQLAWQKQIIKEELKQKKNVMTSIRKRESKERKFLRV